MDRAVRLAESFDLDGPLADWRKSRDTIRKYIFEEGFNDQAGVFTSELNGNTVDPSLLVLTLSGCVEVNDQRMQATGRCDSPFI